MAHGPLRDYQMHGGSVVMGCMYLRRSSERSTPQCHHLAELHWMKRGQEERGWWESLLPPATCSVGPAAAASQIACAHNEHEHKKHEQKWWQDEVILGLWMQLMQAGHGFLMMVLENAGC